MPEDNIGQLGIYTLHRVLGRGGMGEVYRADDLELGQSVSLAGIRARTERRKKDGIPGLAMVPFIGALFGRHSREVTDDESYMLVVPSVVEPVSIGQRNRVEEALRAYESFRGGVAAHDLIDEPRLGVKDDRGAESQRQP